MIIIPITMLGWFMIFIPIGMMLVWRPVALGWFMMVIPVALGWMMMGPVALGWMMIHSHDSLLIREREWKMSQDQRSVAAT